MLFVHYFFYSLGDFFNNPGTNNPNDYSSNNLEAIGGNNIEAQLGPFT